MKFTIILNQEVELKRVMNALSQMSFGLGHRLEGYPDINIVFGTNEQVRAFRSIASKLAKENPTLVASNDFPHTMVGRSTDDLLNNVVNTPEKELTYFGACFMAEQMNDDIQKIVQSCSHLKTYVPFASQDKSTLLPPPEEETKKPEEPKKITMLIASKTSLADILNNAVLAALNVGKNTPYSEQYLLNIGKEENGSYQLTNISFHSNIILKADPAKFKEMSQAAEKSSDLISKLNPSVAVVFGNEKIVESVITKNNTRLFSDSLKSDAFVSISPTAKSNEKAEKEESDETISKKTNTPNESKAVYSLKAQSSIFFGSGTDEDPAHPAKESTYFYS